MFVTFYLTENETYISKLKYVLCQLRFAQILPGEGEKKNYFPVVNKLEANV